MEGEKVINEVDMRQVFDEMFEKMALMMGGLVAVGEVGDALAWKLIRALDATRRRAMRRLEERRTSKASVGGVRSVDVRPHPAIEEFLGRLRRERMG